MSYKGVEAERYLVRYLKDRGYHVTPSKGSRGPMDILAWKEKYWGVEKKRFAIQVKATRESELSIENKEVEALRRAAKSAGFEPVLAVRFSGERWRVWLDSEDIALLNLEETDFEYLLNKFKNRPNILLQLNDDRAKLLEEVFAK